MHWHGRLVLQLRGSAISMSRLQPRVWQSSGALVLSHAPRQVFVTMKHHWNRYPCLGTHYYNTLKRGALEGRKPNLQVPSTKNINASNAAVLPEEVVA